MFDEAVLNSFINNLDRAITIIHRIVIVVGLHRPKTDLPRHLASINTHCQVRGVAQFTDRIYVVCAGYGTVEIYSASDCHWLNRVVIPGMDDPHDLQVNVVFIITLLQDENGPNGP